MSVEPDNIIQNANDSGISSTGIRSAVFDGAVDFGNDVRSLPVSGGRGRRGDSGS